MSPKSQTLWTTPLFAEFTYHDRGSWKKPLHDKAEFFERNARERHNILGSYPSSVRLIPPRHHAGPQEGAWQRLIETGELPPGWTFDHGTTGLSNVAHTSSWTGCLLTSQAFRVAHLREAFGEQSDAYREAHARAHEIIGSIRILTEVSGRPGYLARGVALGHGISYEEREGVGTRDLWSQGAGPYAHLRYRGGPSHHNYDQVFRGLGIYYFVAADEGQKDRIRDIVSDMSDWAHLRKNMVVMHTDGECISTELIGGWRMLEGDQEPSGGSAMALAGLKIASAVTGNERVEALYQEWVDRLGLRDASRTKESIMGPPRGNYDDTDHLLGDLYLLSRIETDEDLLFFYRKCVVDSWKSHKHEKMAWFNYVYRAVLGDQYGDPEGCLWNLRTHPTCRVFQPRMNSIRDDIEIIEVDGKAQAAEPLPVHERASDNEYEWKGSPFALDGWLTRTVTVFEVSPHDSYVQFAADRSAGAYWSNTRGETWHEMTGLPQVHDFLFSVDYPWIAFAATDGGVYRTLDGGTHWSCTFAKPVKELTLDPTNTHILYAVGQGGVYRSEDRGERDMGVVWRAITEDDVARGIYTVDVKGGAAAVYLLTPNGLFVSQDGGSSLRALPQATRRRGFSSVDSIGGRPLWLRPCPHVEGRLFRAVDSDQRGVLVSVSDDGGATWSPVLRELKPLFDWHLGVGNVRLTGAQLKDHLDRLCEVPIADLRVDPADPDVWYGLMETGVAVTRDAGDTWTVSREGLDIPRVHALWTPRHAAAAMVGTPSGMYVTNDKGATWTDTSLILQDEGALRAEIGGIGYLTAYWMGRYHGFISDEEAHAEWWHR
jgi:hypothetical protein